MPDWLSHILIGLIVAELFNIDKKGLVVLGSLLPDFIVKINILPLFFHVPDSLLFVASLYHSWVMAFIIPALIVPLFKYDWKRTYLCITSGFVLHLLTDGLGRGFSNNNFSLGIYWPEQYWMILVPSLVIYIIIKFIKYRISPKNFKIF